MFCEIIEKATEVISWQAVLDIFTVISTFLVFLTLREMQKDRENAYRPDILIKPMILFCGNSTALEESNKNSIAVDQKKCGVICIDGKKLDEPLTAINVGVGTAKNVQFAIDKKSLDRFIEFTQKEWFPSVKCEISDSSYMFDDALFFRHAFQHNIIFMKAQAEQEYDVKVLSVVFHMLSKVFTERSLCDKWFEKDMPAIHLNIFFEDVQDIRYEKKVTLDFSWNTISYHTSDESPAKLPERAEIEIVSHCKKPKKIAKLLKRY